MGIARSIPRLSKRQKVLLFVTYCLLLAWLFLAGAEMILRLRGLAPWQPEDVAIQVYPGEKFFTSHPTLGYTHLPGTFSVTLPTGYTFDVTHLPNTLRITHPLDTYQEADPRDEIWIFGCSFTHGWSLNDDETYPWLLQERLPDYEVVNFGVSGYGTIHSLIQFREALETRKPRVAVLAYADFHDIRNTFLRTRRKGVAPVNKLGPLVQPYARLKHDGTLQYAFADVEYRPFPLMQYSALAHFLEIQYNKLERSAYHSHTVSEALVLEMARIAEAHQVPFVIAGIAGEAGLREMLRFAEAEGIPGADISVNLRVEGNNNLPHDNHPSARANRAYADRLESFLKAEVLREAQ